MLLANRSLDDSLARRDWNWSHEFDLDKMTAAMLRRLRKKGVGDPARDPLMKQAASAQRKVRFCCAPAPCLVVHMALMHSRAPVLMPRLNSRSKQRGRKTCLDLDEIMRHAQLHAQRVPVPVPVCTCTSSYTCIHARHRRAGFNCRKVAIESRTFERQRYIGIRHAYGRDRPASLQDVRTNPVEERHPV